jgi:hypothetical protein
MFTLEINVMAAQAVQGYTMRTNQVLYNDNVHQKDNKLKQKVFVSNDAPVPVYTGSGTLELAALCGRQVMRPILAMVRADLDADGANSYVVIRGC